MNISQDNGEQRIAVGKYRRLQRLSDEADRFAMLAIDQRGSLRKMLAARSGQSAADVPDEAMALLKSVVTSSVAPLASAVLTSPLHGYPTSPLAIPPRVGLLLALEVTGYEAAGEDERLSRLIEGWSARAIAQAGADAVKLLLWYRPDATVRTMRHQDTLVEEVGAACAEEGLPFVLEVLGYPAPGQQAKSAAFTRDKPEIVIEAARHYSDERFGVDLLKMEFPGNLKYVEEYQQRPYAAGEVVHTRADIERYCRQLDEACGVPWVILSAGVDPDEFIENVRLANAAGASGFLCGRAVWKEVVDHYPDEAAMRRFSEGPARDYFTQIRAANDGARPWTQHPRFSGGPHALRTATPHL